MLLIQQHSALRQKTAMTRILIIDGPPDPADHHFIHAAADAYAEALSHFEDLRTAPAAIRTPKFHWRFGELLINLAGLATGPAVAAARSKAEQLANQRLGRPGLALLGRGWIVRQHRRGRRGDVSGVPTGGTARRPRTRTGRGSRPS